MVSAPNSTHQPRHRPRTSSRVGPYGDAVADPLLVQDVGRLGRIIALLSAELPPWSAPTAPQHEHAAYVRYDELAASRKDHWL